MRITSYQQLYNEVITKVQWARFGRNHMENYRGHALREYELLPGLGRYNYENEELKAKEKCLYENFLKQVEDGAIDAVRKPFKNGDYFEIKNYWYSLFQAQPASQSLTNSLHALCECLRLRSIVFLETYA